MVRGSRLGFAFLLVLGALAVGGTDARASGGPVVMIGDVSIMEGDSGAAVITVPIDLSSPAASSVVVSYKLTSGTALAGSDFGAKQGNISFAAGVTAKTITVSVNGDLTVEADEFLTVDATSATNASLVDPGADPHGTFTITNDDTGEVEPPGIEVSIGESTVSESDGGAHYVYLPVTLSEPATTETKVEVLVDCGSASPSLDYEPTPTKILTYPIGQRVKTLKYEVLADTTAEQVEQFIERIRIKVGDVVLEVPVGTVTILDDDSGFGQEPIGAIDRVSVASDGTEGVTAPAVGSCMPALGGLTRDVSADGRYALYISDAENLVSGDTNRAIDVFVRDRLTDTTERVNLGYDGSPLSTNSLSALISEDGRYVAFESSDPALTPPGVGTKHLTYVRDRVAGTSQLVSVMPDGSLPPGTSAGLEDISADGRHVVFIDGASMTLYVRDRVVGSTQPVTVGKRSFGPAAISADGRYVAFISDETSLVANDTNNYPDVFVKDMTTGTVERVNLTPSGAQEPTPAIHPQTNKSVALSMSADGRYVTFSSSTMGPDASSIFVRDRVAGTTTLVDRGVTPQSSLLTLCFSHYGDISDDGRYVSFTLLCERADGLTRASDLRGVYVRDRVTGVTTRVDQRADGTKSNADARYEVFAGISADGRYVVFDTRATNLVSTDTNDDSDVFVKRVN